jgi:hypothetical protein
VGRAARLQKLVQFKGKPKDLVAWLKDEYAHRKGVDRAHPDVLSGQPAKAADAKPAAATVEPKAQPGPIIDAEVADDRPAAEQQPLDSRAHAGDGGGAAKEAGAVAAAERAAAAQPMTPARVLADKFKKQNLRSI